MNSVHSTITVSADINPSVGTHLSVKQAKAVNTILPRFASIPPFNPTRHPQFDKKDIMGYPFLKEGATMSEAIIGKWGKSLAIRIPLDIEKVARLNQGESVDISLLHGKIVIQRPGFQSNARAIAEEMIAERKKYTLDNKTIQSLLDEGRRQ